MLQLLSRIESIVPDLFQGQEGLTSDDVQAGRLVIHNKVLRRRVASRYRQGPCWRGSRNSKMQVLGLLYTATETRLHTQRRDALLSDETRSCWSGQWRVVLVGQHEGTGNSSA